jgi:hypothetical protein
MKKFILLSFICLALSLNMFGESGTTGSLTWVYENETLTISGEGAMPDYDSNGGPWYIHSSSIKIVDIKNSVTNIGNYAFYYCSELVSVTIPNGVKSIGNYAFYGCSRLTSVAIPVSVTNLGRAAFCESALTSITIPNGITNIGDWAFGDCANLTSVTILGGVTNIGNWAFIRCYALTSITIPNGVSSIGNFAFAMCQGLTSVMLPNSLTSIGEYAFTGTGLASITIPKSVTNIGDYAFNFCSNLRYVEVQWTTPLYLQNALNMFRNVDLSVATLFVPFGTKSLYNGYVVWRNFGTIVEKRQILAEEKEPVGAGCIGKLDLTLSVPDTILFNGYFILTLPVDFHLDTLATGLSDDLKNSLNLTITPSENGCWMFSFNTNPLDSNTGNIYQKIVEIVYTIDKSVTNGAYRLTVNDLLFAFDDESIVIQEELFGNVTVNQSTTIASVNQGMKVHITDSDLYLDTPVAELISVYSVSGNLLYQMQKQAGEVRFNIGNFENRILIVKGGSGWVKKIRQ